MILTNLRAVLVDRVVEATVRVRDGTIVSVDDGPTQVPGAVDLQGDLLLPGLVELHTDNLERHLRPRPGADWPAIPAVVAHDAQVAGAGITTVLDAIGIGAYQDDLRRERLADTIAALDDAQTHGLLKADHLLHLRCEVTDPAMPELLDTTVESPRVRLISVMDHTPGQRQFASLEKFRAWHRVRSNIDGEVLERFIEERYENQARYASSHRRRVVDAARARGIPLASHDDATVDHVAEAVSDGVVISEFPTTVVAAQAARAHGLAVLMGAPNLVRGGSHSGNVSALALAEAGLLDIVSSDYAPASLLHSAFELAQGVESIDLPAAVATVTRTPARVAGLDDRGEIAPGRRADLLQVSDRTVHPVIRAVWRSGERVG